MNSKFDKRFTEREREREREREHTTGLADGRVKDKEVFNAKRDADALENGSEKRKFGWEESLFHKQLKATFQFDHGENEKREQE